jgi:serine protease Do
MNRLAIVLLGTGVLLTGCACKVALEQVRQVEQKTATPFAKGEVTRPLEFRKIVVKLPRGERIGSLQSGTLCTEEAPLTWQGGRVTLPADEFIQVFREELEKANCPVVGNPDTLFEDPSEWDAEYLVAGLIKDMKANICYPYANRDNYDTARGSTYMKVDWQIYSRLRRRVVYEASTEGVSNVLTDTDRGDVQAFMAAFAGATQNLLADDGFRRIVSNPRESRQEKPDEALKLAKVPMFSESLPQHITRVRPAVVTVFAGEGHGSGFFIGSDGHLLTNEHVVRDAHFVTIKLVTGRELVGEVLRKNVARDVALVKAEETSMLALPIKDISANIADDVYAIGSPIDEQYSATLTKGVVSGFRTQDGLKFIQSDVNILPGSSGGPLLDAQGNVVGIAVRILFVGAPSGLNFFVPIDEALDALNIQFSP